MNDDTIDDGLTRPGSDGVTVVISNPNGVKDVENTLIEKGNTILGLYRIESDPFIDGFGRVFHVHHIGWKVDLAMKQPRREMFERDNEVFIRECEAWMNLGLHPHIVPLHYVQKIDGIPFTFSEWIDGSSLNELIAHGTFYEGSEKRALEHILDIFIQLARGLHYIHEKGWLYLDVKPHNILLNRNNLVKILATKALATELDGQSRIYTPVYCSPEQKNNGKLTRRTDIWSWAISVLEIFLGERPWSEGAIVGMVCEDYFDMVLIPMPEAMKDLLRQCFCKNEAERPQDFGVIEAELLKIYQAEIGRAYPRPTPKAASFTAGCLNNYALSYLDLDKSTEAEKCWEQALKINPNNAISRYNQILHLWKTSQIDDVEAVRKLTISVEEKDRDYYCCLAKLHIARNDVENAIKYINEAIAGFGETEDLKQALAEAQEMKELGLDRKCIRTFQGHNHGVESVCFSRDGRQILSGSKDETLKLWDVATGECIRTLGEHTDIVCSVCLSPDGKHALSCSEDHTVKIWVLSTGTCLRTLGNECEWVSSVCISPDGRLALWGTGGRFSSDSAVKIWDIVTGEYLHVLKEHWTGVTSVCFNPDGKLALSGGKDRTLKLWDVVTGECIRAFRDHSNAINSVCFSPDGKLALSGSSDNTMKLWNVATGECISTLEGHKNDVYSVCFSPDGKLALSGSADKTIKVWDIETGRCLYSLDEHTGAVYSVCFSPDGKVALSGSADNTMKMWHISKESTYDWKWSRIQPSEVVINESVQFDATCVEIEQLIAQGEISSALDKLNELREIKSFASSEKFFEISGKLTSYCVSRQVNRYALQAILTFSDHEAKDYYWAKGNYRLLSGNTPDHTVKVWDVATGECIRTLEGHKSIVQSVCFSPDGRLAASGSMDRTVNAWDIETSECIFTSLDMRLFSKWHKGKVNSVRFSPDGKLLLSGSDDKTIKVWDIEAVECVCTFGDHSGGVRSVCFSPDGRMALSNSMGEIKVWDIRDGYYLFSLKGQSFHTLPACFNPKGGSVLGSDDETVKVWDLATHKCTCTMKGHTKMIESICFSPDGMLVLSGSWDQTVKLWNLEKGECIHTFTGFTSAVRKVCFSPDGRMVMAATQNEVRIYVLDYNLHFPGWQNWDEGARPYLYNFCVLHPCWKDKDFNNILTPDLQNRGYGWLRPEGVRAELDNYRNRPV